MISTNNMGQQVKRLRLAISFGVKFIGLTLAIYCIAIMPLGRSAIAAPDSAASIEMSRAAKQLDDVVGAGTSDQLEGKIQKDIGTVKREFGKATGQIEGATDQVKGRAKEDIGRLQSAIDEAGDEAEETAEGLIDSIKDVFN